MGCLYEYIPENIKNEHRVHHQFRIFKSYFKDRLEDAYPYLVGSNIDISNVYKIEKYIVMCPTNSHFKKENYRYRAWPLNNWQELIDRIINKTDLDIVITGNTNPVKFIIN